MTNSTVKAVQTAADQHLETAQTGFLWAIQQAAKWPVQSAKDWFMGNAGRDLDKADAETHRVSLFNEKLDSCHSCIAPDAWAGDDETAIEAAIDHFDHLAADCLVYSTDLRAILNRQF